MTYVGLGSRYMQSAKDQTGLNIGSLTTAFTSGVLGMNVANYEMYHILVNNVPVGAQALVMIDARQWGFTNPVVGSEWDPVQPMLLNPGNEVYFLWNIAASVPSNILDQAGNVIFDQAGNAITDQGSTTSTSANPQVTCWFRYDPALPGNS